MTDNTKSNSFSIASFIANVIGVIWSVHVLIAALIFPNQLLPNEGQTSRQNIYKMTSLLFGTLILFVNGFSLAIVFTRHNCVDAAKVFFIWLTWLFVGIIYILFNHLRDIYELFALLEEEAIQSRDQSVMLIRTGQAALKAGNRKLFAQTNVQFSLTSLMKSIGPLALLYLRKEKSLFDIALEAGKMIFVRSRLFKNLF